MVLSALHTQTEHSLCCWGTLELCSRPTVCASVTVPPCRGAGSPGRRCGATHAPGMTEHSSPGRAPAAATAALGV